MNKRNEPMSLSYKIIQSPVGKLKLVASDKDLVAILWENDNPRRVLLKDMAVNESHPILLETQRQLGEYFAGERSTFSVALDTRGSHFQKSVWDALLRIPFCVTRSYGRLSMQLVHQRTACEVGEANARIPVS